MILGLTKSVCVYVAFNQMCMYVPTRLTTRASPFPFLHNASHPLSSPKTHTHIYIYVHIHFLE